jgi:hypothetical protein
MFIVNKYINNLSILMNYKHFLLPYFKYTCLHLPTMSTSRYLIFGDVSLKKQPRRDYGLF